MDRLAMQTRTMQVRSSPTASTQSGGAGHRPRPSHAVGPVAAVVLVSAAVFVSVGCGSSRPAVKLADGSAGKPLPAALERLGDTAVLTRERTVTLRSIDARGRACVALSAGRVLVPHQPLVERIDHLGSSVTFRPRSEPFVYGCTSSGSSGGWCGHVVGEVRQGHLVDPRLDIACRTAAGDAIGSAWIEPVALATWIIVRGQGVIQIYPTAASLPVRVTTLSTDIPTATAVFRVEQYDAQGTRVSEATLKTAVAG